MADSTAPAKPKKKKTAKKPAQKRAGSSRKKTAAPNSKRPCCRCGKPTDAKKKGSVTSFVCKNCR